MARHGPTAIVVTCLELSLKWLLCRLLGVVYCAAQLPMICIELLHKNSVVPRAILSDLALPLNLVSCTEFYHVGDILTSTINYSSTCTLYLINKLMRPTTMTCQSQHKVLELRCRDKKHFGINPYYLLIQTSF